MPASVSEQEERRGGGGGGDGGGGGLLRQLELRCRMLEIDNRAEVFRCEEYRKLMMESLGGGVHPVAEPLRLGMPALLPVPVEPERGALERELMVPAPVGGSESSVRPSVAQPAALLQVPVPPVAVAPAATPARAARRRTVLPSSVPPSPELSRLVGAAGRGRGRGRGRGGGASAGPVSLRTQRRLPVVCVVHSGCCPRCVPRQLTPLCRSIQRHRTMLSPISANPAPPPRVHHQNPSDAVEGGRTRHAVVVVHPRRLPLFPRWQCMSISYFTRPIRRHGLKALPYLFIFSP